MISDFVSGKADLKKIDCRNDEFWKANNVEAVTGKKATALKFEEKTVQLESGRRFLTKSCCLQPAANRLFQKRKAKKKTAYSHSPPLAMHSRFPLK